MSPTLYYCSYRCPGASYERNCGCSTLLTTSPPTQSFHHQGQAAIQSLDHRIDPQLPVYDSGLNIPSIPPNGSAARHLPWGDRQPSMGQTSSYLHAGQEGSNYTTRFQEAIEFSQSAGQNDQTGSSYFEYSAQEPVACQYEDTEDRQFSFPQGMTEFDSIAMGTQFSQVPTLTRESVDEADLEDVNPEALSDQRPHAPLPFRLSEDYNSPRHLADRTGQILAPGPRSSHTSYSDPDGSVPEGRYPCLEANCNKTYKARSGLRKHAAWHKPDYRESWKFQCSDRQCGARFQYQKDLSRHIIVHKTEPLRPYKCRFDWCEYHTRGFKRRDHLIRHHRIQHNYKEAASL